MNNMESLHNEFEKYFNDNQEKINYFLDVLKNVKEDRWEYEYSSDIDGSTLEEEKTLIYDKIMIKYVSNGYFYAYSDNGDMIYPMILIWSNNVCIFQSDDETDELFIEILTFIERAEKRAKGE